MQYPVNTMYNNNVYILLYFNVTYYNENSKKERKTHVKC